MKESRNLEFKEMIQSNTFLKTVSAFANYGTGRIIFGIDDDGMINGIKNAIDFCLSIENKMNDNMNPVPLYDLNINDDSTITLTVYESDFKPYLYKGKAYKRHDTSTIEVDRLELNRLILEESHQSYDELVSQKQDLTFNCLEKALKDKLAIQKVNDDILKTLDLYTKNHQYNNAAALLADQNDYKGVDMIRFGQDIDEIMDRVTLENKSILLLLEESVEMYKKYYQYEKIDGTSRKIVTRIPENAFREAIANAIIHRFWDIDAFIMVSMFDDRIEIRSPGGLPSGMSESEYLDGQISMLRNPIIGNVFYRLRYIEMFGTGIKRINKSYNNSLTKPQFKVYENSITIILPTVLDVTNLTSVEQLIVQLFHGNLKLSRAEIEKQSHYNKAKLIRILNSLSDKNIIYKSGKGRAVKYHLR